MATRSQAMGSRLGDSQVADENVRGAGGAVGEAGADVEVADGGLELVIRRS